MPIYGYKCAAGHGVDHLCRHDARPSELPCPCGLPALPVVSAAKMAGTKEQTRAPEYGGFEVRVKGGGLEASDYLCDGCGDRTFEVEVELPLSMPCACGGVKRRSVGVPDVDWITKMGPGGYFCDALGIQVTSKGQREREMKKRGLVDGSDVDFERLNRQHRERAEASRAWAREEAAVMDRDADLCRKRDAGLVPSWEWMRGR